MMEVGRSGGGGGGGGGLIVPACGGLLEALPNSHRANVGTSSGVADVVGSWWWCWAYAGPGLDLHDRRRRPRRRSNTYTTIVVIRAHDGSFSHTSARPCKALISLS